MIVVRAIKQTEELYWDGEYLALKQDLYVTPDSNLKKFYEDYGDTYHDHGRRIPGRLHLQVTRKVSNTLRS